jgi:hypothetical protein
MPYRAMFGRANNYHSMYDNHADGSPVVLCSLRRPLLCLLPDHYLRFAGCEHGFSADLHLLGWLSRQGFTFDVAASAIWTQCDDTHFNVWSNRSE